MSPEQLTILTHVTAELASLKKRGQPMPLDTQTVSKYLEISSSTLNRAKNSGNLPYLCHYRDKIAEVHFSHQNKHKDYWLVYTKEKNQK